MLYRAVLRSLRLTAGMVVLMQVAACATKGSVSPRPPVASVATLYRQLDQASRNYEIAWQQTRTGDTQGAQKMLDMSLDQLHEAAARCGVTPRCNTQRFFSVFDHLLRLQNGSFFEDEMPEEETGSLPRVPSADLAGGLPQVQRSVTLLRGHPLSELIAMNGPVKAALELWLTQWRGNLMKAYVNYQFLRQQMWQPYQNEGLPEALLFGMLAKESGGKVHAVSRSGAAGPLQFMYATGLRFGLTDQDGFDLRFDPTEAARANAQYINEQLKIFNDNLELTLAAYNGGEGRMRRLVGGNTSISFYDPRIYAQVSQETREYVPEVLAAAWLFLHPDAYNLRFPRVDVRPGSITLKRSASLSELTVCLASPNDMPQGWFRTLRNLNPRLDPQQEQPTGTTLQIPKSLEKVYAARCVNGPWPMLASDLHNAVVPVFPNPPVTPDPVVRYTVRRGDTLAGIVRKQGGCSSETEVARVNHLKFNRVKAGQVLKLASCR